MSEITRFGVSIESNLINKFDRLITKIGYKNRSEAIRDLIRERLVAEEWKIGEKETVGVITLIYNHEVRELTETLTDVQHKYYNLIISSTHIHLDKHNCLEVIVVKGKSNLIKKVADNLVSTRSVKHGKLIMTTTGKEIS
ncbi:MAG: nickel-responsive transcriptional regulator NikR [Candidatus Aminicenantia bacterium]